MTTAARYSINFTVYLPFEQAIERVKEALKAEGFGVLTEIDVKATMKQKIDVDFEPYTILGACNPHLAYRALNVEREIGTLLPCNVVVQQCQPGRTKVMVMDPMAALGLVGNDEISEVATEARARLERAIQSLSEHGAPHGTAARPVRSFSTLNPV